VKFQALTVPTIDVDQIDAQVASRIVALSISSRWEKIEHFKTYLMALKQKIQSPSTILHHYNKIDELIRVCAELEDKLANAKLLKKPSNIVGNAISRIRCGSRYEMLPKRHENIF